MTEPDSSRAEPGPDATVDDLQADIEETRADLGDTARALTDKLDVKARAGDAVDDAKHRVVESATTPDGSVKPGLPVTAIAVAVLVIGVVVWRRRRR
jgi:uncharacterized protein DUF3618